MKNLCLHADDFGLAPGVNEAILELLENSRMSGTSVMTVFDDLENVAIPLKKFIDRADIGLHLTLTDQPALNGASAIATKGAFPNVKKLILSCLLHRMDKNALASEISAQLDRFERVFDKPPSHIDGHHHVHVFPVIREVLLEQISKRGWNPVFRDSRSSPPPGKNFRGLRAGVVQFMAQGFAKLAHQSGYFLGPEFTGFYDSSKATGFADHTEMSLQSFGDSVHMMCHPGQVDSILESRDGLLEPRQREFEYLASDAFAALLQNNNAQLVSIRDVCLGGKV